MGSGTYALDTSAWRPVTLWQSAAGCVGGISGNCNSLGTSAPSNMSAGIGPSCCSWGGGSCSASNQNCVFCSWYTRSTGFWWDAGTYTLAGNVDDGLVMRLVPASGAAIVAAGSKGCCSGGYSFTFTVPVAGMYVTAIQLNNNEYCAFISITSVTWSSGAGLALAGPVVSNPPSSPSPSPPTTRSYVASTNTNCFTYTSMSIPSFCGATTSVSACQTVCTSTAGCVAFKYAARMNTVATACPSGGAGYSWCMPLSAVTQSSCVPSGDIWDMYYAV